MLEVLAEANDAGTILRYYIYGAGLLAQIDATTGDIYTYHFNNAGNTMAITDQTQEIVNSYSYTPFGIILAESENIDNPFKFAGQYGIMHESGSIFYMRARYYDASIGRFLSEDPSGFVDGPNLYAYVDSVGKGQNNQFLNLYQYAGNNPVNRVDPSGLWYFDLNFSFISPSGVGGTGGFIIGKKGIYRYQGVAAGIPGPGASFTFSLADPTTGWNGGAQGGFWGGFQMGEDSAGGSFFEIGLVTPGASGSNFFVEEPWEWPWGGKDKEGENKECKK